MSDKDLEIAELRALVAKLIAEVADLKLQLAKAKKDSSNSSKSPSIDIVKPPKKKTDRRKKTKQGRQKGHARKLREPLPPERVDEEITYEMSTAETRDLGLTPKQGSDLARLAALLSLGRDTLFVLGREATTGRTLDNFRIFLNFVCDRFCHVNSPCPQLRK